MAYSCNCKRGCQTFREHVGNGPMIDGKAMPTRSRAANLQKTEDQWEADGAAYKRLDQQGYQLQKLDGAADLEKKATTQVELQHGKLYGKNAKLMQAAANGDLL